ncbi:MICAL-like protein 1 [Centropristis striata]|uniref:MICAL-like protein 1 n=1 Tax=Centropristis striata TaxID=184440 RepID=UPI0027DEDB5D|nr:MICAL-like protein 1 [Centropristis striata]
MSNLTQEMASQKTVQEWCCITCANYPNVEIKNMSTSFRDGLAFCAIIHKHRPDLIDFSSLSKDNVFQNNKLAFEIAERKLGIPALLDPKDLVSTKVPDCLSVITYLSQYYHFFNRKSYGLPSLRSSHVTSLNNLSKSKTPDGLKPLKSPTEPETSREDRSSSRRPRTVCVSCFMPVHLIQRRLIDGKVYHRSCFRCTVCRSTLLPGSYTQGGDDGSLICIHHITDSKSSHVDLSQQSRSTESHFQPGYFSLGGSAISSVPHYTKTTESQDRLVCTTPQSEGKGRQERIRELNHRENRDATVGLKGNATKPAPPQPPPDTSLEGAGEAEHASILAESKKQQEVAKTQESRELSSPCAQVTEGSGRPVPAPRRMLDSSGAPVPAPRTRTASGTNSSPAAGQHKGSPNSSHITSPARGSPKIQTNHPWMTIVHPGPWTQLPPAPAPVPTPRSKSVSKLRRPCKRPTVPPPPNPFGEDEDEDTKEKAATPGTVCSSGAENTDSNVGASSEPAGDTSQLGLSDLDETEPTKGPKPHVAEASQSHILSRSVSVPAITSAHCQSSLLRFDSTEENKSDQFSSQSKLACKENPFDRKPAMSKSKTFQDLPSTRAPAPGHGFPLIKRKVQTDQNVSKEDLQVEIRELDKQLEALEQRGVELEGNLRDEKNDVEEEQMLMEWFSLVHERHVLVCRETELVYLTKQHKLEERQADVEYELRCLLNKPESDWSEEDRGLEQQLMDELVAIIEQRNQIVSSLDQDRQREREEDLLLESMMKNKNLQKEGFKEVKKSKGKFKSIKMFKRLNHKAESSKDYHA